MSGLPILHGLPRSCCVRQEWRRRRWINAGRQEDSRFLGCMDCGAHYRWEEGYGWREVSAFASLQQMVENDPRGTLEIEK